MKYRTIVADPPWEMKFGHSRTSRGKVVAGKWNDPRQDNGRMADLPYQTMNLTAIAALPIPDLAEDDAHLYIWTVNKYLRQTYDLASGWGFKSSQLLTWAKKPMGLGLGGAFVQTTEHVLFCRRGVLPTASRVDSTWFQWPRGKHSVKPEAFLDMVETVSPGPYLELFARRQRIGWDSWGNECRRDVEMPRVCAG